MLSKNIRETTHIAQIFLAKILKEGKRRKGALVVGLSGDLGAGKTAFTKSIAKHLKIKYKINSPTFVIVKKYPLALKGYKFLFHIDAYRLKNEKELLYLGWEEIVNDQEHIIFIEWPEHVSKLIPAHAKSVYISLLKNGHRNLKFK